MTAGTRRVRAATAVRTVWSSAGVAIAVLASAIALGFSLWPALRPDPRESLAAELHVKTVERGVTLRDYLTRRDLPADAGPSALRAQGQVVYLQVLIKGRKHGELSLLQVLYNARTRRRIPGQGDRRDSTFEADTPNDQWIYPVFVADANGWNVPVFVRLELFDRGILLAFADTPRLAS
jgi:hypothetical protein